MIRNQDCAMYLHAVRYKSRRTNQSGVNDTHAKLTKMPWKGIGKTFQRIASSRNTQICLFELVKRLPTIPTWYEKQDNDNWRKKRVLDQLSEAHFLSTSPGW